MSSLGRFEIGISISPNFQESVSNHPAFVFQRLTLISRLPWPADTGHRPTSLSLAVAG